MANTEIPLRGHHLFMANLLIETRPEVKYKQTVKMAENYGTVFACGALDYYSWLKRHPRQRLTLVAGKEDYFCTICPKKRDECLGPDSALFDTESVEYFGFEMDTVYTVKGIMDGLRRKRPRKLKF